MTVFLVICNILAEFSVGSLIILTIKYQNAVLLLVTASGLSN
jgi:hypothetical protein